MLNRKTFKNLDHTLIVAVALLLILGLLVLSSATLHASSDQWYYVKRQAVRIGIGLILVLLVLRIDYSLAQRYSRLLYSFNLLFLFSVLVLGKAAKGSQAWLKLGEMVIQPSELAKIIIIVTLAAFLVKRERLETFRDLIPVFLYVGAPLVLILLQPDLGTALVYLAITLG
ncbi:MAG: FtsW/RodA/SpoVE family cell cycle protein, partial [Syntrophomonadaceae bacterium]|nr:FtsW/RodA/SpoVE family cell cycle protein [Syntrophomonadaceae bacterium]